MWRNDKVKCYPLKMNKISWVIVALFPIFSLPTKMSLYIVYSLKSVVYFNLDSPDPNMITVIQIFNVSVLPDGFGFK